MNRGQAERAVAESTLTQGETLTMMMLLRRSDNDTLIIPEWRTPTLPQLAAEVRVSTRWLRSMLDHLGRHGWVKVIPGRGRGHKSTYALMTEKVTPSPCDCRKKGNRTSPFTQRKGDVGRTEKGNSRSANPQVSPDIAPRAPRGKGVKGEAPPRCTCGAPIGYLRMAQAGPLCVRCEATSRDSHADSDD